MKAKKKKNKKQKTKKQITNNWGDDECVFVINNVSNITWNEFQSIFACDHNHTPVIHDRAGGKAIH